MNAVTATILATLLLMICAAPRRWALLAMIMGVFFLTQWQTISLAGLNLYPLRFLEAAAFARVIVRRELVWSRLNRLDAMLLLVYNYSALVWSLRAYESAQQIASALDPTLCYLALRALMQNLGDLRWLLGRVAFLLVPYTTLVFMERVTGHSSFSLVGSPGPLWMRNGVARCEGSFRHATILGSVAASFFALYAGLFLARVQRLTSALGGMLCLILVVLSNSGGSMTATVAAVFGWGLWIMRRRMQLVRRVLVVVLVIVAVFMKAPIWYLPFKISFVSGGDGFHRSYLMDQAWHSLDQWWLAGMDMRNTANWFGYTLEDVESADITNQFLVFGFRSGLGTIILFVALLVLAFQRVGRALQAARAARGPVRGNEYLIWGLGVVLIVHLATWFGTSYFDQSWVIWLTQLAAISCSMQGLARRRSEASPAPVTHWSMAATSPGPGQVNHSVGEMRRPVGSH